MVRKGAPERLNARLGMPNLRMIWPFPAKTTIISPFQVCGDRFRHNILPNALCLIKTFKIITDPAVVLFKNILNIGPVRRVGRVDLFGKIGGITFHKAVDSANAYLGWNMKRQVQRYKPYILYFYKIKDLGIQFIRDSANCYTNESF